MMCMCRRCLHAIEDNDHLWVCPEVHLRSAVISTLTNRYPRGAARRSALPISFWVDLSLPFATQLFTCLVPVELESIISHATLFHMPHLCRKDAKNSAMKITLELADTFVHAAYHHIWKHRNRATHVLQKKRQNPAPIELIPAFFSLRPRYNKKKRKREPMTSVNDWIHKKLRAGHG